MLVGVGLVAGMLQVHVHIEGNELFDVDSVCWHQRFGVAAPAGWRETSTCAAADSVHVVNEVRCDVSAPPSGLMDPLSVISRASIDGGSSSTIARATKVAARALCGEGVEDVLKSSDDGRV